MSAVRLVDHATLIRGITFKPVDKCDPSDEGAVVCMRTKNVQATLDASDLIAVPSRLVKNPEKMLSTGDILVSSANSWNLVGKCCQVPKLQYPSTAGGFISILRPKTKKLESSYLYRWFSWGEIQRKLRSFANQTTNISNLDHKRTLELQIPLPPLAEQKRIAGILDAADALRAKRREALAQLDTLIKSTFLDMFGDPVTNPMGWEVRELNETKSRVQIGPFGSLLHKEDYIVDGVPLVNPMHIVSGQIHVGNEQTVSEQKAATLSNYRLQTGDVIMGRRGEMGRCAIVSDTEAGMLCGTGSLFIRPHSDELSSLFLARTFSSESMKRLLEGLSQGVTMPNLNRSMIEGLKVELPPLDLQRGFSAIVESIEQQKVSQRTHLADLDILFASLQSRAFRGDL